MPITLPLQSSSTPPLEAAAMPSQPIYVEIASTPRSDGSWDVNWSLNLGAVPGVSNSVRQLAGGALHMLPTDNFVKLLLQIRAAARTALQNLTMAQIVSSNSALLNSGGSFYHCFGLDLIAVLPTNTALVGQ
jgi:hypothetical protein